MFLSEISPRAIRGGVGVLFQLTIVLGIVMSQILGFEMFLGTQDLWPYLLGVNLVLGILQLMFLPFCPRSPRFLLIVKKERFAAMDALARLRGESSGIKEEMEEILEEDRKEREDPPVSYRDFLKYPLDNLQYYVIAS